MVMLKLGVAIVALVALVVITLMGIAVCGGYGYTLRDETTLAEAIANTTSMTILQDVNVRVGAVDAYPFLQTLTRCFNASVGVVPGAVPLSDSYFSILESKGLGDETGGYIILNTAGVTWNNTPVICSTIKYLGANTESVIADKFKVGLALFGTFAGILVLSILGMAIVRLFKKED